MVKLNEEVGKWERYKARLWTSGPDLSKIAVDLLRDFFELNVNTEERYIEDAVLYDDKDQVLFVVEIKGMNGGLAGENI